MNRTINTIIIGAGASGLFLATLLNKNTNKEEILILEHNEKVGSKVLISGGGKCNITNKNIKPNNYLGEQKFISNILKFFKSKELLFWLKEQGLVPQLRQKGQYFCRTSASEIVELFKKSIPKSQFRFNVEVDRVEKRGNLFEIFTSQGIFKSKNLIVASGGLSFPKIGASSIGYDIAKSFGHQVEKLSAGLVGLTLQPEQFFFKSLSGISTNVEIKVGDKIAKGALLFAHKGISGPAVLDASLYWDKGQISINFLPHMGVDSLKSDSLKSSKKKISNLLGLSSRLAKALLDELSLEDKSAIKMSAKEWEVLKILQNYTFAPAGTFGYGKAEVTKGGVATEEIDSATMMSKKVENLYFLGEVLDVTGELGGYNFQWAFSTAFVCAKAIR